MAVRRSWGVVTVAVIVVLLAALSTAVLGRRVARPVGVDPRARIFPSSGVSLRPPSGWVDKRGSLHPAVVLELEDRPRFPNFAVQGLWISRWSPLPDARTELAAWRAATRSRDRRPSVDIDGHRAEVVIERIGPDVVDRLPLSWSMVRTRYRFEADGLLYEVGFWNGPGSGNPNLQRKVLASVRVTPPTDRIVRASGLDVRVPGRWHRGAGCGECWFSSPGQPAAWVYVLDPRKGRAGTVADDIEEEQRERVGRIDRSELDVAGRPAVRLQFTYPEPQGSTFEVEDLVIQRADGEVVIVAMGWRTPAGRAELDAITASLVPAP